MAGPTGLEPATSGVTGLRSNQLSYDPDFRPTTVASGREAEYTEAVRRGNAEVWWEVPGSNRRPAACKADALPLS